MKLSMFRRRRRRSRQTIAAATALNENESTLDTSFMTTCSNNGSSTTNCDSKQNNNNNNKQQMKNKKKKNQQQHHRNSHRHSAYDNNLVIGDNSNSNNNIDDDFVRADDDHYYNEYRVAEVGRPKKRLLRKVETMKFKIHDFVHCEEKRGQYRITPTLKAHGYNWKLQIYPYGDHRSSTETEHVSCFLHYFASPNDREEPSAKVTYRVATHQTDTQLCAFSVGKGKCSTSWGLENFIKRKKILEKYLNDDDGSLTIEIDIQIAVDRKIIWYPTMMRREPTLTQLYVSSSETGDVTFRVPTTTTITTTNTNTIHQKQHQCEYKYYKAHKMILALRAKILYELVCEESSSSSSEDEDTDNDENAFVVDLPGIDCETFETMLEYVYTVKRPLIEDVHTARKLLVAADRLCLTELKLYTESVLADKFVDETNAAELLLFADSYSCALLKETTMDVCVSDPNVVMKTPGWALIEESDTILTEVFEHTHTGCRNYFYNNNDDNNNRDDENSNSDNNSNNNGEDNKEDACTKDSDDSMDLGQLDVFYLRERLDEADLDVDGSRETLIGRLEDLLKSKTETTTE
jgi:hypothetical protein